MIQTEVIRPENDFQYVYISLAANQPRQFFHGRCMQLTYFPTRNSDEENYTIMKRKLKSFYFRAKMYGQRVLTPMVIAKTGEWKTTNDYAE